MGKVDSRESRGPFRADQLHKGDPYELSNGHAIRVLPQGGLTSRAQVAGTRALTTDPAVDSSGIDTGFSPEPGTLRAPDIAIGNVTDVPGWVPGVPPLAVEYAGPGQDEKELDKKIGELSAAGTVWIWVVRTMGPRRVEIYKGAVLVQVALPGQHIEAPGILANPVLVDALYDDDAANEAALRNLLQRAGYASLDAVRDEGQAEGKAEGKVEGKAEGRAAALLDLLDARNLPVDDAARARILGTREEALLSRWLRAAVSASSIDDVFA